MIFKRQIPFIKQTDSNDCGLACLAMISAHFGKKFDLNILKKSTILQASGVSIHELIRVGKTIGLKIDSYKLSTKQLKLDLPYPLIAYWNQEHFIIIEKNTEKYFHIIDPAVGRFKMSLEEFWEGWQIENTIGKKIDENSKGIICVISILDQFYKGQSSDYTKKRNNLKFIKSTFLSNKSDNLQVLMSLFVVSTLQLTIPFLNQLIIDVGIKDRNIDFIYILGGLIGLFYLLLALNEFIRSWSLVYLSTRINYELISKFLLKITNLPISILNSKKMGDYIERIHDHKKVEELFSQGIINSFFSILKIIIYAFLLLYYSPSIFGVVCLFTTIELLWIFNFLKSINTIDNRLFGVNSQDQDKVYEILSNLADIKLNLLENEKNQEWQRIQAKLFKINISKLKLDQIEKGGSNIISSLQFTLVIILVSNAVITGNLTLGAMLSVLFVVNQLNQPISNLIHFVMDYQRINNSFDRISEISELQDDSQTDGKEEKVPNSSIRLKDVSFSYDNRTNVLENINFSIRKGETTALVGYSGSGKTTIIKLLLKFYKNYSGNIFFEENNLAFNDLSSKKWREKCGTVLQESSIYSETIAYNISLQPIDKINPEKLNMCIHMACLHEFINELPMGVHSKLNTYGTNLSSGQKQRLFLARLFYRDPEFVFLDEATNSLDAFTEEILLQNLNKYFSNATKVVVAHRLSTVKTADQILVIDKGKIVEAGRHFELIRQKGKYYELIKNQLELEYEE